LTIEERFQVRVLLGFFRIAGDWFVDRGDSIFVLSIYILLTILFTWPLAANFTNFANGSVQDVYHELWYLNLDYHLPYGPFFALHTNSILYPYGVPLYFQVFSPLHAIIGAPIYYLFGLVPAYNFLYMFTFFVSAFTMYLLAWYLTGNRYAAFFAGLVFGFAPVHTGQGIAHLNIMASELLPLFALFFIKMARERRDRNALYAGILIALNAMLDLHFLLLSGMIVAAFLLYSVFAQKSAILNKTYLIRFFVMILGAGLIGFVVYYQTFYGLVFAPSPLGATAASTLAHPHRSPDLLQFLLPAPENPFFGRYTAATFANFISFPQVRTYIGYTALALSVGGVATNRSRREVIFWGFLALFAFAIALGPQIQAGGEVTVLQGPWTYIEYLVPIFRAFRTPYRIDYLVALGVAVLSGYGIAALLSSIRGRAGRRRVLAVATQVGVAALLSTTLIAEFLPTPYPMLNTNIDPFYTRVLANDHANFTVLEVPAYPGNDVYLYYQTAYHKPLLNGHISRTPASSLIFLESTPFIDQFGQYLKGRKTVPRDILNQTISNIRIAPYILDEYHIKYIIVHKDLLPNNLYTRVVDLAASVLGFPYYEDRLIIVFRYESPPTALSLSRYPHDANVSFVGLLNGGWNSYGLIGHHARSMDISAALDIYSQSNQLFQLKFKAEGLTGDHLVRVEVDGNAVGTYHIVNGSYSVVSTPFVWFHPGMNKVVFTSEEGCRPISIGPSAVTPSVCASIQFASIAVVPLTITHG